MSLKIVVVVERIVVEMVISVSSAVVGNIVAKIGFPVANEVVAMPRFSHHGNVSPDSRGVVAAEDTKGDNAGRIVPVRGDLLAVMLSSVHGVIMTVRLRRECVV